MRAIIRVDSGLRAGHRFTLRSGEQMTFGRTERADAVFGADREMSGLHFKVQIAQDTCYLEDLESKHGTEVNGQSVKRVVLRSGERIKAGGTMFSVEIDGAPVDVASISGEINRSQGSVVPGRATFCVEQCKTTLYCYRGAIVEMPATRLASALNRIYRTTLILEPAKIEPQPTLPPNDVEHLFNWLPDNIREGNSPVLLFGEQAIRDFDIVHAGWGKDTLVVVFSDKDEPPPLTQLRRCAGVFVRPSLLRPQLSETVAEMATDFMLQIEAAMVEDESAESWLLFSAHDLTPLLEQIGLQRNSTDAEVLNGSSDPIENT